MRLIRQSIEKKTGEGRCTMSPEEPEDMWHAYNLIREGDTLRATAVRKVATESLSGSTSTHRVRTTLTITVTKLDFDSHASQLHVSGRVSEENKHVKLGSFHTLDLELNREFTLEKAGGWDSVALDTLKESINEDAKAQMWAVLLNEGLANICLVTSHQTILRQQIETNMPKKRPGSTDHDTKLKKFYQRVYDSLLRQIDLADPKPILLASPGFTASEFQKFFKAKAEGDKKLKPLLVKITVAHAASAHVHALAEVLKSQGVTKSVTDARFSAESQYMEKFLEMLRKDDPKAWYGPKEVEAAAEQGAIGKGGGVLLISNSLFRSQEIEVRKRWVKLVDSVKEAGGDVKILSSMHESGKKLEDLSGVAAILTYPIEDLDELVEGVQG
ncbi:hypothetical protein B0A48_01129 [Cryoendolithus antarcticus]|uniref:Protein DOM34 homolog n=1 Tax=Cryoendolithus antarcticus TaxID=1507870 RepID=A0A1V8TSB5_9PEZI|nr:hypothetical protein B0A48_01129 [Cryoendolithus antarcticus]